ncbi:hypothetical protein SH591_00600 [Sphingomonas sp. LY54]|uniref:hypothetical protein n=1 Tax=Sphingomonas sp. LY54 TaxID=3095343 RepID=UPI002D78A2F2|nr:hypothetical protein [Sphingomonas sp. LY54]WRP28723.1 hypothetical protein SH591_00600 [Sphingomonas sp. LY54]
MIGGDDLKKLIRGKSVQFGRRPSLEGRVDMYGPDGSFMRSVQGGGAPVVGTYSIDGDRVCVEAGIFSECKRYVVAEDGTILQEKELNGQKYYAAVRVR